MTGADGRTIFQYGDRVGTHDQYVIGRELDRGATAIVFRASSDHGKIVAVKQLRPERQTDPVRVAAFAAEAKTLRDLGSNSVHEAHELYIVIDFVPGRTLREVMDDQFRQVGVFSGVECLDAFRQLAEQLAQDHRTVTHRDLKPNNAMLDTKHRGWNAKIIDYGLGLDKDAEALDPEAGTALYKAPEQWKGQGVDGKADIYALTCMLFEAHAGEPPFFSRDLEKLNLLHCDGVPPLNQLRERGVADRLVDLIRRGLAKKPAERPDARAFADELSAIIAEELRPTSPARLTVRRLAYAGSALLLAGFAYGGFHVMSPKPAVNAAKFGGTPIPTLNTPDYQKECGGFTGTDLACIPGGEFEMGLDEDEIATLCDRIHCSAQMKEQVERSTPKRRVQLSTFAVRRFETTCREYAAHLNLLRLQMKFKIRLENEGPTNPDGTKGLPRARYVTFDGVDYYDLFGDETTPSCVQWDRQAEKFVVDPKRANRPVEMVSHAAAETYCDKQGDSLPTEAQAERIRRILDESLYPTGTHPEPTCDDVAFDQEDNLEAKPPHKGECRELPADRQGTRDVGTAHDEVAPLGVHDLDGNVTEWTADGYLPHYAACPGGLCVDPRVPAQPNHLFVIRGASLYLPRWFMYSAFRGKFDGELMPQGFGIRCVRNK